MKIYTVEEIKNDILLFEGVEVEVTYAKKILYGFTKLYSDWKCVPSSGNEKINTINETLNKFLSECGIPLLSVPVDPSAQYILYAGHLNHPLSLIISTNDEITFQKESEVAISKDSPYTVLFAFIKDETFYMKRSFQS